MQQVLRKVTGGISSAAYVREMPQATAGLTQWENMSEQIMKETARDTRMTAEICKNCC